MIEDRVYQYTVYRQLQQGYKMDHISDLADLGIFAFDNERKRKETPAANPKRDAITRIHPGRVPRTCRTKSASISALTNNFSAAVVVLQP
jgi:hypothetical protein